MQRPINLLLKLSCIMVTLHIDTSNCFAQPIQGEIDTVRNISVKESNWEIIEDTEVVETHSSTIRYRWTTVLNRVTGSMVVHHSTIDLKDPERSETVSDTTVDTVLLISKSSSNNRQYRHGEWKVVFNHVVPDIPNPLNIIYRWIIVYDQLSGSVRAFHINLFRADKVKPQILQNDNAVVPVSAESKRRAHWVLADIRGLRSQILHFPQLYGLTMVDSASGSVRVVQSTHFRQHESECTPRVSAVTKAVTNAENVKIRYNIARYPDPPVAAGERFQHDIIFQPQSNPSLKIYRIYFTFRDNLEPLNPEVVVVK